MNRKIYAVLAFVIGVATSIFIYWLGGGEFDRGSALAATAIISLWVGLAAAVITKGIE